MTDVRWVKKQACGYLLDRPGVVACGVGFKETGGVTANEQCVVVSVERKIPKGELAPGELIPQALGAVRTDVREVGIIRALQDRRGRCRPAPGGVSIGHVDVTAGTLGCLVRRGDEYFILSNNHVLANSNAAEKGDPIIQPGRYDGGTLEDQIAALEDFVPLDFGGDETDCPVAGGAVRLMNLVSQALGRRHRVMAYRETDGVNRVDAAIARPLSDDLVDRRILDVGTPRGVGEAVLGMAVKKNGRTTGFTTGKIVQIDVTAQVNYGERIAVFEDQVMAGPMSQGGDSGSVVLDENGLIVGLLFAGSDAITLVNPIQFVLDALKVEIVV